MMFIIVCMVHDQLSACIVQSYFGNILAAHDDNTL